MPQELQALYADTLRRIDPNYSSEAYIMLQIALCSLVPLHIDVFVASVEFAQYTPPLASLIDRTRAPHSVETMISQKNRLTSRSGRLLELTSSTVTADDTPKSGDKEPSPVVQIIHQMVREYFLTVPRHKLGLCGILTDRLKEDGNMFLIRSCVGQDEWNTCIKRDLFLYAKGAVKSNQDRAAEINSLIERALPWDGDYNLKWYLHRQSEAFSPRLAALIVNDRPDLALSRLAVAEGFPEYVTVDIKDHALIHAAAARTNFGRLSWDTDNRKAIKHLLAIGLPVDVLSHWRIPDHAWNSVYGSRYLDTLTALGVAVVVDELSAETRFLHAKELLESGANPNAVMKSIDITLTPLQVCVCRRDVDIVRLLLHHGADANVSTGGWDLLHLAYIRGDKAIIQALLNKGLNGKPVRNLPEYSTANGILWTSVLGLGLAAPTGGLSLKLANNMYHVDFDSLIREHREEHRKVARREFNPMEEFNPLEEVDSLTTIFDPEAATK